MYIHNKFIYIYISNPFSTMRKLKGIFKPLRCNFLCGKKDAFWKAPIFWGNLHPIQIIFSDVRWKDKYDTPRYEEPPYIWIHLFRYNLIWYWTLKFPHYKIRDIDQYWEQALWYLFYYTNISYGKLDAPDINKARESWPWIDINNKSTWTDEFLVK